MTVPYGVIPPILTAWKEDGTFDEPAMRRFVNYLIDKGVHGVVACGSTGEFISMTDEERKKVAETVVDEAAGRIMVLVGTAHYSTDLTIKYTLHAKEIGADGAMIIAPYYLLPPKPAAMQHFRDVAKATEFPITLYSNIWFAGYDFTKEEVAELANDRTLAAIKCAHGDPAIVHNLKATCRDDFSVLYGHDYCGLEALLAGADGWLSGCTQAVPDKARALYDAAVVEKNVDKSREIWYQILPLINYATDRGSDGQQHFVNIYKAVMEIMGVPTGKPRKPMYPLPPAEYAELERIMDRIYA